jgi:hypothetical protein
MYAYVRCAAALVQSLTLTGADGSSAEGPFACSNTTIQYNDIGPCGSQSFQQVCPSEMLRASGAEGLRQWADGISLSCSSSLVQHNTIVDATDGGEHTPFSHSSHVRPWRADIGLRDRNLWLAILDHPKQHHSR